LKGEGYGSWTACGGERDAPFHGAGSNIGYDTSGGVGRDAGKIAEEVISHLVGQMGAEVTVTIEVEAKLPNGASDQLVRTVRWRVASLRE
jgi:hypothetical protein